MNFEQDWQPHCALGKEEGRGGFKLSKEETDVSARTRMCVREGGSERAHSFASDDDQPPPGDFPIKHGASPSEAEGGFPLASTVAFRSAEGGRGRWMLA